MEYKIICEKCKRPAEIKQQTRDKYITNTTYKNTCDCGGKIKVIWD